MRDMSERLRNRSLPQVDGEPTDSEANLRSRGARVAEGSLLYAALIATGSALLTIAALFAWQAWSSRSAPPVDDLLPMADAAQMQDAADTSSESNVVPGSTPASLDSTVEAGTPQAEQAEPEPVDSGEIIVHVSGAVETPGVVRLEAAARVFDAVELAGGSTSAADLDRVNLAAPLIDGERIHVPTVGQDEIPQVVLPDRTRLAELSTLPDQLASQSQDVSVDINHASLVELQNLPGVGPATAAAIVRTREERGPYLTIEDLLAVPGIAETRLEQLRPYVQILQGQNN